MVALHKDLFAGHSPEEIRKVLHFVQGAKEENVQDKGHELFLQHKAQTVPPHGTTALLNAAGVNPNMMDVQAPPANIAVALPLIQSEHSNQIYEYLTSQTAATGDNATDYCDTPPEPGHLKKAQISTPFGKFYFGTKEMNILEGIEHYNRADVDRNLMNNSLQRSINRFTPDVVRNPNINNLVGKELMEMTRFWTEACSYVNIQGNVSNTGGAGRLGWIDEPNGFDQLIKTGHTDVTAALVPALDSIVQDYSNGTLNSTFVQVFSDVMRQLQVDAMSMGYGGLTHLLVIPPNMLFPLVDAAAAAYYELRQTADAGNPSSALAVTQLRNELLSGMYIPWDNRRVPFVVDWNVQHTYDEPSNVWTGEMYFIPLASPTGEALTWNEYLQLNPEAAQAMGLLGQGDDFAVLNNGLYLATRSRTNMCVRYFFAGKMRMILSIPPLAAKIENINYSTNVNPRDPRSTGQYHQGGGQYVATATY